MINRDDMLELTRRMTLSRNCFSRIVGAYIDEEGFVEGTFNTHFQKLTSQEQDRNLKIAKAIPFAETNTALKQYTFDDSACGAGSVYQFLRGSLDTDFTNDAIFDVFYEMFGERYVKGNRYAIYFFLGNYDIKLKGSDKVEQSESEYVYKFMIAAICPLHGDYELDEPEAGFLFPAYDNKAAIVNRINVLGADVFPELVEILGAREIDLHKKDLL